MHDANVFSAALVQTVPKRLVCIIVPEFVTFGFEIRES